jgi:hypothetical protein
MCRTVLGPAAYRPPTMADALDKDPLRIRIDRRRRRACKIGFAFSFAW